MVQPQYIFCPTGLKETLAQTDKYKNLTAVQEGRVYEMDPALMQWQGNGVSAVSFMAGTVYPSLAEGNQCLWRRRMAKVKPPYGREPGHECR